MKNNTELRQEARKIFKHGWKKYFAWQQVKEKYGLLCLYCTGGNNVQQWARKYEELSEKICITCGKPATHMTTGWITYRCKHCIRKIERRDKRKGYINFKLHAIPIEDIEEFYKDPQEYWLNHPNV